MHNIFNVWFYFPLFASCLLSKRNGTILGNNNNINNNNEPKKQTKQNKKPKYKTKQKTKNKTKTKQKQKQKKKKEENKWSIFFGYHFFCIKAIYVHYLYWQGG